MTRPTRRLPPPGRVSAALRRSLLAIVGAQFALAVALTLVDSYRRRGKKPRTFPVSEPEEVTIGDGPVSAVKAYTFGADLYDDMLAAIEAAEHRILLESYIWKGDAVGERFKRALYEAAGRGVEVHVIFDGFANLVVSPRFKRFPPPIRALKFPVYAAGLRFYDLRRYGRDHRKILVVDDEVAFVGGYNIGAAYATLWRDTHVRVTGPAVYDLTRTFADFWNLHRGRKPLPIEVDTPPDWEPRIRVHRNIPRLWMFPIRSMYLEAINRASRRIWLTQAYFIPDDDFVGSLTAAARRGVDVKVLVPEKSNHIVADWLSHGYYGEMLAAGIEIHRYQGMVHAKTATIDGAWSTVGTANIDRLSMTGNYEVNVEFIDPQVANQMELVFRTDLTHCVQLTGRDWSSRPVQKKAAELFLAPLRPLL